MKNNFKSHIKGICDFLGVKTPLISNKRTNSGFSLWQNKVALLLNNLFESEFNSKGLIPVEYCFRRRHPHRLIFQSEYFPDFLRGKSAKLEDFINPLY